jgi:hypothetical protein
MEELTGMTGKLRLEILPPESAGKDTSWVGLYLEDGSYRGRLPRHTGGHEFNSFVIALSTPQVPVSPWKRK